MVAKVIIMSAPNEDTYCKTIAKGAKGRGCITIHKRKNVNNLLVGTYFVEDIDWMDTSSIHWKYVAICDHGSVSPGAPTRQIVIDQTKMSHKFCRECKLRYRGDI